MRIDGPNKKACYTLATQIFREIINNVNEERGLCRGEVSGHGITQKKKLQLVLCTLVRTVFS